MRKKSTMKIARGRLEEDRRKSEQTFEYQRVMLFILPLLMIAVLIVGIYFGYLSYSNEYIYPSDTQQKTQATEPELTEQEQSYLLTIVSSASPVDADFVPQLTQVSGVQVSSLMADNLSTMLSEAKSDGMDISVISGYISFEEQKQKYDAAVKAHRKKNKSSIVKAEAAVKTTIPNAGECEQQTGLIVELSDGTDTKFSKTDEYNWLVKNSVNYGFILRYPDKENTGGLAFSPSLFRYVGVDNAYSMRAYNMNLDEYVQYLAAQ